MNEPLHIFDPIHHPGWDELLLEHPDHSFFHSAPWARVLQGTYRYRPLYVTRRAEEKLSVLVPLMEVEDGIWSGRRGISLPFTDHCEPILSEAGEWPEIMSVLLQYGKHRGWRSLEIRGGQKLSKHRPCSSFYIDHTLSLARGEDALFAGFHEGIQQNIRNAALEGVSVAITRSSDAMEEFYRLNCMRKAARMPPQPLRFFKNLYEHVIAPGHGFIALARRGSTSTAAAVYFHFGRQTLYTYGASDKKYQNMGTDNLIMWEAIKWSVQRGDKVFRLGMTDPEKAGLRQLKTAWGAEENILNYYLYDIREKASEAGMARAGRGHSDIFKRLPKPLLKIAGRLW